jgi:hypothetical protein
LPLDHAHLMATPPAAGVQVSLVSPAHIAYSVCGVSLEILAGWQKSAENNGYPGAGEVLFPFLHWHPSLQVVETSEPRHLWMSSVSFVRSIGAQKS